jgi:tetratricopeptide (TPR) repeat protein
MIRKLARSLFLALVAVALCQTGCKTVKPIKRLSNEGFMYAMIYDYDNSPVTGVTVWLNGKKIVDSDIQGRFILEKMKKGEYGVKLTKKGYETLEEVFYYDPLQVLYFKIINASQLLAQAETALDNAEFVNAEKYLDRALLLEPNRPDILFLKSVSYYLQDKSAEAASILENLIKSGSADPSISRLLEKIRNEQEDEG